MAGRIRIIAASYRQQTLTSAVRKFVASIPDHAHHRIEQDPGDEAEANDTAMIVSGKLSKAKNMGHRCPTVAGHPSTVACQP
jgi:hypothetical protein